MHHKCAASHTSPVKWACGIVSHNHVAAQEYVKTSKNARR